MTTTTYLSPPISLGAIADPASPNVGQLWLSTTTANALKYADNAGTPAIHQLGALDIAATWDAVQTYGNNISIGGAQFNISGLVDGHIIAYNGTTGKWTNRATIPTTAGVDSVNLLTGVVTLTTPNSTLTIGTSGQNVTSDLNLGNPNTWTALQAFNSGIQLTAQSLASSAIASITGTLVQTTTANTRTRLAVAPAGTSNISDFAIFRTSDITTNYEALFLASESPAANEFGIGTYSAGTGVIRPFLFFAAPGGVATEAFRMTAGPNLQLARDLLANASNITGVGYFTFNAAIADASAAGKLFLSSTTANVLKYYDTQGTPVLHQLAALDLAQTFTGNLTMNGTLTMANDILASSDNVRGLGSTINRWNNIIYGANLRGYGASGDTAPQVQLNATSASGLAMGPGGATATDTVLSRAAVSLFSIAGIAFANTLSKTAAYTAVAGDTVILASASGAAFTVTLPAANVATGKYIIIIKTDSSANAVTVSRAGTDTIEGATTKSLASQYSKIALVSDGTSIWYDLTGTLV